MAVLEILQYPHPVLKRRCDEVETYISPRPDRDLLRDLAETISKEFYTELSTALFGYLEDKLHIPKSEFTIERAAEELRKRNLSEDLITNLKTGAEKCEFVRFAPGAEKSAAMQEMYDEIANVIINIEKNFIAKRNA